MNIECPKCKKMTIYAPSNPFRPFCSERCRLIDTAAWADEQYAVPSLEHAPEPEYKDSDYLL